MLSAYILLSLLCFYFIAIPVLNGDIADLQFYADSATYEAIATGDFAGNIDTLTTVDTNFFGPVIIFKALNCNRTLVYLFNCTLFLMSYYFVYKYFSINRATFLLLLFINPIMLSSLLSINKEIISLITICLLIVYVETKYLPFLIFSLVSSIFARWQLTGFVILCVVIESKINFLRDKRYLTLIATLSLLSILYPISKNILGNVIDAGELGHELDEGGGLFMMLENIQREYWGGYLLVFVPKTIMLLTSLISRIHKVFDFSDFYNNVIQLFQSIAFVVEIIILFVIRKQILHDRIFHIALIYCAFFALTPIFTPRYFFPVYILFAIVIASHVQSKQQVCSISGSDLGQLK